MTTGKLLFAVEAGGPGAHPAADGPAAGPGLDAAHQAASAAERAGFAFLTLGDQPAAPPAGGRVEAGVRAAYLSQLTSRIGLAPTLHVTTTEPFHLATQLASLDHASHGRAAWVVGAANDAASRATIGEAPLDDAAWRQEIRDVIDVARALWDSWEDDAVIKDVATGRFLDQDKVHHVRFEGASFGIVGPLITPRPPQGQVVVVAADTLGVADRADITLVGGFSPASGPDPSGPEPTGSVRTGPGPRALAARAARAREAGSPLVFAELEVALDRPGEPTASRLARLDARQPWPAAGRARFTGTAADLREFLAELADPADPAAAVDGVLFYPAQTAADLPVLADEVLPALISGGLARVPGPGDATLRDVLGLPRPASRFALPPLAAGEKETHVSVGSDTNA